MTTQNLTDWYALWMQQSRHFFESADEQLKSLFSEETLANPEANLKQIHSWLASLTTQTLTNDLDERLNSHRHMITQMYQDAGDLMLKDWLKRAKSSDRIVNMHDLYGLWLEACKEVYQRSQTQT